jgi:hypothetical protein
LESKFDRGDYSMNLEAALVEEAKEDSVEKIDPRALRSSAGNIPQPHAAQKPNLSDRIKRLLANVAKALEGDHGTQKYRG